MNKWIPHESVVECCYFTMDDLIVIILFLIFDAFQVCLPLIQVTSKWVSSEWHIYTPTKSLSYSKNLSVLNILITSQSLTGVLEIRSHLNFQLGWAGYLFYRESQGL